MEELVRILKKHNIRPSVHRVAILKFLSQTKEHPTAEDIYNALCKDLPTMSRTTVYNTLKTLYQKGIVSELNIDGGEVRYDFDTSPHAHFKCRVCGRVFDLPSVEIPYKEKKLNGHRVEEVHIYFYGVCKECLSK